ncbi:MAG TPA: glycerol-3-phosphate dehydrogenase [Burkholderiaceae bacterium]|nr:glycerol-3-phosphate dehydrogenase [Burkholderiaceae bacterium]
MQTRYDVVVIGGGINGAGIARDAAGRGLSVLLCEQHDLAQHTSSASTKLIHGGLRYLEYYEFGLVRKALREREVLLRAAPHIIRPLRFVMPYDASMRPQWMIRAGLFLYDHLARRELLPGSSAIDLRAHPAGAPLRDTYRRAFVYSDGWVDDARLVVLNAIDASERGATVLTRTRCVGATREQSASGEPHWKVRLRRAGEGGAESTVTARALVNAAGPWAASLLSEQLGLRSRRRLRQVKGSHIVVPALFEHPFAYIFQNPDRRIIFAIPFERRFTLIGTTDVDYPGDPGQAAIDAQEIDYLCANATRYFRAPVRPADVVWTYSGVRPLLDDERDDARAVTRDYQLELDRDGAPLLSVLGGKITTFRKLAEEAVGRVQDALGRSAPAWTAAAPLPGGDLPGADFERFEQSLRARLPWLAAPVLERWARAYGTRIDRLVGSADRVAQLGAEVAPGLYEAELDYLRSREWAATADDALWRRTKLGLQLDADQRRAVADWFESARARVGAAGVG